MLGKSEELIRNIQKVVQLQQLQVLSLTLPYWRVVLVMHNLYDVCRYEECRSSYIRLPVCLVWHCRHWILFKA